MEKPKQRKNIWNISKKSLLRIMGLIAVSGAIDLGLLELGRYFDTPIYVAQVNIDGDNRADLRIYTRRGEVYSAIQDGVGSFRFLLPGEEERLKQGVIEEYKKKQKSPFFSISDSSM